MDMDDCERFIDAGCEPPTYELPLAEDTGPGQVRCGCCGGNSFERIGIGTVAFRIKVTVGFENEVLELQPSDTFAACCDFEPSRYRCVLCDVDAFDLADLADARPWAIGARAVLPDGSEARVEAIGPDRIVGRHREPTAVCAGATYLLRDLCALDPLHPEQLAFWSDAADSDDNWPAFAS
jgi:hypothetical protein